MKSFWIRKQELLFYDDPTKQGYTEVIEYSAYEALRKEYTIMEDAFRSSITAIKNIVKERDAYREALEYFEETVDPHGLERDYQSVTHECADKIEEVLAKYPKRQS